MPIYEYRCEECEDQFEELLLGSEPDPDTCPKCGAEAVRRVISSTSFQLKGGGWYVTDYKSPTTTGDQPSVAETSEAPTESSGSSDTSEAASSGTSSGSEDSSAA